MDFGNRLISTGRKWVDNRLAFVFSKRNDRLACPMAWESFSHLTFPAF